MERRPRQRLATCALLLSLFVQVGCQLCGGPCNCPSVPPLCPAGVPLVWDGCRCCQVCARQKGEACNDKYVCDSQRGLQCDYSASFPGGPGECVSQDELGCEVNGVTYQEGQVFQPSCATQCRCSGGGVTCVPLCRLDVRLPGPDCPHPRHVQLPGKCCKEWVCENMDNTILQDALAAHRPDSTRPGFFGRNQNPVSNCIEQSTAWSACSQTCGPGVSTRVSNKNWACRLERQTRYCKVQPCHAPPRHAPPRRPHPGKGRCEPSYRAAVPEILKHRGCYSTHLYRPKYCGLCSDGRCCTPYHTRTVQIAFRCPQGRYRIFPVMAIDTCICHYNCPNIQKAVSGGGILQP